MSLTFSLNMAYKGLLSTESSIRMTSQNITNADKAGYTKKTYNSAYVTSTAGSTPIRGTITGALDRFLAAAVVSDVSTSTRHQSVAEYMDLYIRQYGSPEGINTLNSNMSLLFNRLTTLSNSPEISSDKTQVVNAANNIASQLRETSAHIQDLRAKADQEIAQSITAINSALSQIALMNEKIKGELEMNAAKAEYEDQRMLQLENLAAEVDIQYFFTSDNQLQVYSAAGAPLLLSTARQIDYTATTVVNGSILYPAGFQPILLGTTDITTSISGGRLGGLLELRDTILPQEQQKLDQFASVLRDQTNAVLNRGASMPPRSDLTGSLTGLTVGTAFAGAGLVRFAVTDMNGVVVNTVDLNIGAYATVGALATAIDSIPNINAVVNANGQLQITAANANQGVSMNQLTSNVGGQSFSDFFGLNDMFEGANAETIVVAQYLSTNPGYLAAGALASGALAPGDRGIQPGDGSVADALGQLLQSNVAFGAAGNFAAQSTTLLKYMDAITASAASDAQLVEDDFEASALVHQQTKALMSNKSGVNLDEETAIMIELESKYQASARVISTIRDMFAALLDAVR